MTQLVGTPSAALAASSAVALRSAVWVVGTFAPAAGFVGTGVVGTLPVGKGIETGRCWASSAYWKAAHELLGWELAFSPIPAVWLEARSREFLPSVRSC